MLLRTLYNDDLAHASYLVGCPATGESLIIDPNRDIDQYIQLAASKGLRITAITETHIHADFVSGARELAHRTGAQLYLSDEGTAEWKYDYAAEAGAVLLLDGDTFKVGNLILQALHTPGHTPEHMSFLVTDGRTADAPMGLFTGDFIFVGDVGRPDLLERAAGITGTMEPGARRLFQSLQKISDLPDYLQVWPAHGAGSACGRALGAVPQSTLGYERRFNWAFAINDEDEFVKAVLAGQPEPPFYFAEMKRVNKVGPAILDAPALPTQLTAEDMEQSLSEKSLIVDVRSAADYAASHIPGTISVPYSPSSFLGMAGWLFPVDQSFTLVGSEQMVLDATAALRLIGVEKQGSYAPASMVQAWAASGRSLSELPVISVSELRDRLGDVAILDVRGASEHAAETVQGSSHIALGYVRQRLSEVPADRPLAVMCRTGRRSAVIVSVLEAAGYSNMMNLTGGIVAWTKAGYPVVSDEAVAV